MTNDPYMYSMIKSKGEVFKGLVHATPVLNIKHIPCVSTEDLVSLQFNYPDMLHIDNALACVGDRSLITEVHCFHHIKRHFAELDEQMKTLEEEMWLLQTRH